LRILRFGTEVGGAIHAFGSTGFVLSPVARLACAARISCAHLGPNGRIGEHAAASDQLLLVVQGSGQVRGGSGDAISIQQGEAALWEKGERHETSTTDGLTAIILEAESREGGVFSGVDARQA
jgi:quercetin dioxygenase-like cupin family protein